MLPTWSTPRLNEYRPRLWQLPKKKLAPLAKNKLLILDEWGMEKLSARQANYLLGLMKERYQKTSIIIAR
ncbi:ATP-binding protein [Alteromonas macleodii]|uniref:ATP-binding protein n=1 Tax=Alteromonas macleodii TaxID=28108 RepID=UPI00384F55E7